MSLRIDEKIIMYPKIAMLLNATNEVGEMGGIRESCSRWQGRKSAERTITFCMINMCFEH